MRKILFHGLIKNIIDKKKYLRKNLSMYLCDKRLSFRRKLMCVISEQKSSHKQRVIAIRCARGNDCRSYSFSNNYPNWIKIYSGVIVRSFAFVHLYPRNIAFELASLFGLSLKLITCWSCAHQPFSLPGFFHPRVLSHSCYFNLPVTR